MLILDAVDLYTSSELGCSRCERKRFTVVIRDDITMLLELGQTPVEVAVLKCKVHTMKFVLHGCIHA